LISKLENRQVVFRKYGRRVVEELLGPGIATEEPHRMKMNWGIPKSVTLIA